MGSNSYQLEPTRKIIVTQQKLSQFVSLRHKHRKGGGGGGDYRAVDCSIGIHHATVPMTKAMTRHPINSRTEKENPQKKKSGLYLTCQLPMTVRTSSARHGGTWTGRRFEGGRKQEIFNVIVFFSFFHSMLCKVELLRIAEFLKSKRAKE